MSEIFTIINKIIDNLFDVSINKKNKEIDFNEKIFKSVRENGLSPNLNSHSLKS